MKKLLLNIILLALPLAATAQTSAPGKTVTSVTQTKSQATPTVAEASDFTAVGDSSGSLGGTYFYFYDADDAHCYQPWYDVANGSTAPTAISGCTLVEVDISANDTASTVAGNTRTALNTAPYSTYFTITGATTHVIVTSVAKGSATDGNIGTSGFSVSKTQGVSSAVAIASASIVAGLEGWKICNYAVNTSTWLAVGKATDTETDGVRLGKGKCVECLSCTPDSLRRVRVSAQASANDYAVIQFK
jgi:hypothetical protein